MYFFQGSYWGLFHQKVSLKKGAGGTPNTEREREILYIEGESNWSIWNQSEILGSGTAQDAMSRSTFPLE